MEKGVVGSQHTESVGVPCATPRTVTSSTVLLYSSRNEPTARRNFLSGRSCGAQQHSTGGYSQAHQLWRLCPPSPKLNAGQCADCPCSQCSRGTGQHRRWGSSDSAGGPTPALWLGASSAGPPPRVATASHAGCANSHAQPGGVVGRRHRRTWEAWRVLDRSVCPVAAAANPSHPHGGDPTAHAPTSWPHRWATAPRGCIFPPAVQPPWARRRPTTVNASPHSPPHTASPASTDVVCRRDRQPSTSPAGKRRAVRHLACGGARCAVVVRLPRHASVRLVAGQFPVKPGVCEAHAGWE
jgi:hypothetical protein